jgi:MFS family permease
VEVVSDQTPDSGPVRQARVRRAPRYEAFLGVGIALGVLVALVSGLTGPVDPGLGRGKLVAYLMIGFGMLGAMVGGLVAVAIERSGRRRR